MTQKFDVVVIGSGPGGYAAAIKCAQKGVSVTLIENSLLGGTCLNRGCIPSKTLLASAHLLVKLRHASSMGVDVENIKINWPKIQQRKDSIIAGFRKGLEQIIKGNKVQIINGKGVVTAPGKIVVEAQAGNSEIEAKKIILATGSKPIELSAFPFNSKTIINSDDVLNLQDIPPSMVIIGGGVIGCEMACAYSAVGTKITIIEALDRLLPNQDPWVGKIIEREFKNLGIESLTNKRVIAVNESDGKADVLLESKAVISAQKILVAVGRKPALDKQTISALGLKMKGHAIAVNEKMETGIAGVYAIGDLVGTTYLAHGAFAEAHIAAENATGGNAKMYDYSLVPQAVYTFPQVASVGLNETACEKRGIPISVGKAYLRANGKSLAENESVGQVNVIRDTDMGKIIGVTIVAPEATELIATARVLLGSTEMITDISFAHPTVSETIKEAWENAFGISLHTFPR